LGVGYLGGALVEKQKVAPQLEQFEKTTKTIKALTSKTIASIAIFGEVTNISDRTITINYAGENLDIRVKEDAQIYCFAPVIPNGKEVSTNVPEEGKAEFSDIKVGSRVNAIIQILSDGKVETNSLLCDCSSTS